MRFHTHMGLPLGRQPRRWSIVYQRFVSDPLAPVRAGSDFYFDVTTMLPKVPVEVFDLESRAWSLCVNCVSLCGGSVSSSALYSLHPPYLPAPGVIRSSRCVAYDTNVAQGQAQADTEARFAWFTARGLNGFWLGMGRVARARRLKVALHRRCLRLRRRLVLIKILTRRHTCGVGAVQVWAQPRRPARGLETAGSRCALLACVGGSRCRRGPRLCPRPPLTSCVASPTCPDVWPARDPGA